MARFHKSKGFLVTAVQFTSPEAIDGQSAWDSEFLEQIARGL